MDTVRIGIWAGQGSGARVDVFAVIISTITADAGNVVESACRRQHVDRRRRCWHGVGDDLCRLVISIVAVVDGSRC